MDVLQVHPRAPVEEDPGHGGVAAVRRRHQRRAQALRHSEAAGAGRTRGGSCTCGSGTRTPPGNRPVPCACGRLSAHPIQSVHLRPAVEEDGHGVEVPVEHRPVERGGPWRGRGRGRAAGRLGGRRGGCAAAAAAAAVSFQDPFRLFSCRARLRRSSGGRPRPRRRTARGGRPPRQKDAGAEARKVAAASEARALWRRGRAPRPRGPPRPRPRAARRCTARGPAWRPGGWGRGPPTRNQGWGLGAGLVVGARVAEWLEQLPVT